MFKQLDLQKKEAYLERVLSKKIIDKKKVRQYAWCGIPAMYRNKAYRVLLDVCSTDNSDHQNQIIKKNLLYFNEIYNLQPKRNSQIESDEKPTKYENISQIQSEKSIQKSENMDSFYSTKEFQLDLDPKLIKQIHIDVDRIPSDYLYCEGHLGSQITLSSKHNLNSTDRNTSSSQTYKSDQTNSLTFIYKNVLKVIAIKTPSIGYVQGMADLLIPLIDIYRNEFFAESTIYFCFSKILTSFGDFFTDGQKGITESIQKIEKILRIVDPELYMFFKNKDIKIHMFAFRWLNCLFVREFKLKYYRLVLDSMLSTTNYKLFLIYFSISILQKIRSTLLKKNFDEALLFLQKINQIDWKYSDLKIMFASAYVNVNIFEKKFYFDF